MKNLTFLMILFFLFNLSLSKKSQNQAHSHLKKNGTRRTYLIRTELNKTEIAKLLNANETETENGTIISEIIDDEDYPNEVDIEIEDAIMGNDTTTHITDYLETDVKNSETKILLAMNNENEIKKSKLTKFLPFLSLIIFIYALIYFNKMKKNKKIVKTYKLFDLDFRKENLITKDE